MERLFQFLKEKLGGRQVTFQPADLNAIRQLAEEKYRRWEWNYGHFPQYGFQKVFRTETATIEVQMEVLSGVIEDIRFSGDFFGIRDIAELEEFLKGSRHSRDAIEEVLRTVRLENYLYGVSRNDLLSVLF